MKKLIFLFSIVLFTLIIDDCMSQWQTDVRLTNDPAFSFTSDNNAWYVASSGTLVHIVWYDNRDGNYEIYYKRSTDEGVNWGADTRLTNNSAASRNPAIAVSGSVVHVLWQDERDGSNGEIYYKRSTDAGISWGADTRMTNNAAYSVNPSVAVYGSVVHVVWHDTRDGNEEIYYKRSSDAGVSWGADTRLTNSTSDSYSASVAVSGSLVHVSWTDFHDGNGEIYYKRSTDAGVTWGADTRLTNNPAYSIYPSVAVSSSFVHVVWYENRDDNYEVYYKRSIDGGITWGADTRLTNNSDSSWHPTVAVSGSVVHIVWTDNREGNREIFYKRSTDGGVSWGVDTRLTNNLSDSRLSSIAVSGSFVHVVWRDNRDGNSEIYYKRNPTGNTIGIKNISSEIPSSYSLQQNYPNPFNPATNIKFAIPKNEFVKITVFDMLGKEIETLVNEQLAPGTYETNWNASNYPSGVYFYKLSAGDFSETKKMLLLK
jgi:hypothetical protein